MQIESVASMANYGKMPPKTKIFVGKLPHDCKDYELRKLFDSYGEVTECTVLGSYAFVHMKTEVEATAAIQALNNWDLNGSKISVEPSTGEKRAGGMGMRGGRGGDRGGRGGMGYRGRGMGGPMRGGGGRGGMGMRPAPYDRRPPYEGRYGPPPGARNGYYEDEYDRRERRPIATLPPAPVERRPLPPAAAVPRDPYLRDPYERYDAYERIPAHHPSSLRRSPPPTVGLERRAPPPTGYDRREDPYDVYTRAAPIPVAHSHEDLYAARDPYAPQARSPLTRAPPPGRYPGPPRELAPRRY